jgi:hypothetical protein
MTAFDGKEPAAVPTGNKQLEVMTAVDGNEPAAVPTGSKQLEGMTAVAGQEPSSGVKGIPKLLGTMTAATEHKPAVSSEKYQHQSELMPHSHEPHAAAVPEVYRYLSPPGLMTAAAMQQAAAFYAGYQLQQVGLATATAAQQAAALRAFYPPQLGVNTAAAAAMRPAFNMMSAAAIATTGYPQQQVTAAFMQTSTAVPKENQQLTASASVPAVMDKQLTASVSVLLPSMKAVQKASKSGDSSNTEKCKISKKQPDPLKDSPSSRGQTDQRVLATNPAEKRESPPNPTEVEMAPTEPHHGTKQKISRNAYFRLIAHTIDQLSGATRHQKTLQQLHQSWLASAAAAAAQEKVTLEGMVVDPD